MKFNEKNTKARLKHTDPQDQVFLYDASIILEFLRDTYINPKHFLLIPQGPADLSFIITRSHFPTKEDFEQKALFRQEVYDAYIAWRYSKDYTPDLESRYKFFMILAKMTFARNGWQFTRFRKGKDQRVFFTPMVKRSHEMETLLGVQKEEKIIPIRIKTEESIDSMIRDKLDEGNSFIEEKFVHPADMTEQQLDENDIY